MFSTVRTLTKIITSIRFTQRITPPVHTMYASFKTFNTKDVLSDNEISIYKKLFDRMDSNRDGLLTKDDLKKGLKDYVNYSASEDELRETIKTMDSNQDGSVDFDEFVGYLAWSRQIRTEEAIKSAFQTFDKNEDGYINKEELREALLSLGLVPKDSLLNNIMRMSGKDSDGKLTLEEFRRIFYSKDITE